MTDTNRVELTGTVDRIRSITTRSGGAMCEVLLVVRKDKFRVTAHGNVAEHILADAAEGARLAVSGSLNVSNWKDEATGEWKNSFSITAWAAQIEGGEVVSFQRQKPAAEKAKPSGWQRHTSTSDRAHEFQAGPGDPF